MSPFAPGTMALVALVGTRIGAALMIAPIWSARTVPASARVALLVLLTVTLFPVAMSSGAAPSVTPAAMLSEMLVGFAIGMGAAVFVGAAEVAGDVLALQSGLSSATTLDPMSMVNMPLLADFMKLFVVMLILSMDGHLLILEAIASSVHLIPVGSQISAQEGIAALVTMAGDLFSIGVRIAAPVCAAVLMSNLAMGILARTAPQLQVFMLAYPLQIAVGMFTLAMALPVIATTFTTWPGQYRDVVTNLFAAFGAR
jgi:flagellar biosynthetic protein FliR